MACVVAVVSNVTFTLLVATRVVDVSVDVPTLIVVVAGLTVGTGVSVVALHSTNDIICIFGKHKWD